MSMIYNDSHITCTDYSANTIGQYHFIICVSRGIQLFISRGISLLIWISLIPFVVFFFPWFTFLSAGSRFRLAASPQCDDVFFTVREHFLPFRLQWHKSNCRRVSCERVACRRRRRHHLNFITKRKFLGACDRRWISFGTTTIWLGDDSSMPIYRTFNQTIKSKWRFVLKRTHLLHTVWCDSVDLFFFFTRFQIYFWKYKPMAFHARTLWPMNSHL